MKSYNAPGLFLAALLWLVHPVFAGDYYPPYQPTLSEGAVCEVKLGELHPAQFCVGEREVQARAAKLSQKKDKKLDKYLDEHIMPIVIGPGGVPYIIDHHHLAKALQESGVRDAIPAKVLANLSSLDPAAFWSKMKAQKWVYPYRLGQGPLDVATLPSHVEQLTDDPYRSLVWAARHLSEDEERDEAPFADFKWADYFRTRIKLSGTDENFKEAAAEAAQMMKK